MSKEPLYSNHSAVGDSKMLQSVAREFVEAKFDNLSGVIGVLLVGSASFDCINGLSDIDLEVVATHELYSKVGRIYEGFEKFRGVEVTWEWMTLEELEGQLKDWRDDMDLWVYSRSKILYDPEHKVEGLLAQYRRYKKAVWLEKLFLYWYLATANAPYDSGKAIQRGDLVTAQLHLVQAMEYYTSLVFILNKSFVPYRKWRLKELSKLAYKPRNYEENLRKILTVQKWSRKKLESKQDIVNELTKNLESKLLEAGVPKAKLKDPWKFKISYVPRV